MEYLAYIDLATKQDIVAFNHVFRSIKLLLGKFTCFITLFFTVNPQFFLAVQPAG